MNRVLLYEPGVEGHQPVILRYLRTQLPQFGWEVVVNSDLKFSDLSAKSLKCLQEIAISRGCNVLHLLTIDGRIQNWMLPSMAIVDKRIWVVGNYYLYTNTWGWRGIIWSWAVMCRYIDRLLVSDPLPTSRYILPSMAQSISSVPDPWSEDEFPAVERGSARRILDLPENKVIFLLFGQVTRRKGVHRILAACKRLHTNDFVVVLAGEVHKDALQDIHTIERDPLLTAKVILHKGPIAEDRVSLYYYSADAILSDYPRWFRVSSGSFTRAIAAGRVPILPDHGVNSEMAKGLGFGITYSSESVDALADVMDHAIREIKRSGTLMSGGAASVAREARNRESRNYARSVAGSYNRLLWNNPTI